MIGDGRCGFAQEPTVGVHDLVQHDEEHAARNQTEEQNWQSDGALGVMKACDGGRDQLDGERREERPGTERRGQSGYRVARPAK